MRRLPARCAALLCIVACAAVAAFEVWPAARSVRTEDKNGDGRADMWRRYDDRGQLAEIDVDSNFDGRADIEEYYERGVLVRRETDRNFNGQADLIEEFDAETRAETRSVVDVDYDGTADLLVLFRDGQPVFSERTSSLKRTEIPRPNRPAVHQDGVRHLARLMDPFESETAVRTAQTTSSPDACVGLSTAGGMPCPRITAVARISASTRHIPDHIQPGTPKPLTRRSSRAPPVA